MTRQAQTSTEPDLEGPRSMHPVTCPVRFDPPTTNRLWTCERADALADGSLIQMNEQHEPAHGCEREYAEDDAAHDPADD